MDPDPDLNFSQIQKQISYLLYSKPETLDNWIIKYLFNPDIKLIVKFPNHVQFGLSRIGLSRVKYTGFLGLVRAFQRV